MASYNSLGIVYVDTEEYNLFQQRLTLTCNQKFPSWATFFLMELKQLNVMFLWSHNQFK